MEKLKVALIGCGKMGMHHLRAINILDNAEVVGVVDPKVTQEKLGGLLVEGVGIYVSPEDMFQAIKPDVVHIVTPPATHTDLAILALENGAHIYVEKPFSLDTEGARSVLELAKQKDLKVCAAHQVLFQDSGRKYKEYTKFIKDIIHVESYFSFKTARASISPVDQLLDILPHPVYLLLSAFDEISGVDAEAELELVSSYVDPIGDVRAVLKKGSATGVLIVSLRGRPVESYLRICGTNGSVNADFVLSGVSRHLGPGASAIAAVLQPFALARQVSFNATANIFKMVFKKHKSYAGLAELLDLFYGSLIQENESPVTPNDILNTVNICEEISKKLYSAEKELEAEAETRLGEVEKTLSPTDSGKRAVLVTGGTGFLGKVLVTELRAKGWPVRVIARNVPSYSRRVPGVEYVKADIGGEIPDEYFKDVEVIVHLAAETAGGREEHEKNTITATRHMIEGANKAAIKKFINISSIAVLKPSAEVGGPLSEESPVDHDNMGRGPYVWGKAAAEKLVSELGGKYGIRVRTIRLGPLVDFENYTPPGRLGREVGPLFVAMCGKKDRLSVCDVRSASNVIRSYVEDFDAAPSVLNLVEPEAPARKELVDKLLATRKELKPFWMPTFLLKFISGTLKIVLRIVKPGKKPLDVYSAFASEKYDASLAGKVIENIDK